LDEAFEDAMKIMESAVGVSGPYKWNVQWGTFRRLLFHFRLNLHGCLRVLWVVDFSLASCLNGMSTIFSVALAFRVSKGKR